jgi:outer membrane protein OmpA-like peptidoglycan-associated protein
MSEAGSGPQRVPYKEGGVVLQMGQQFRVELWPEVFRARLTGLYFDTNKSFLLPGALHGIRTLRRLLDEHQGSHLLITGHTDRAGSADYNLTLSQERAAAIAAYLRDQVDPWMEYYHSSTADEKRWGAREDGLMIAAVVPPERLSGGGHVLAFQQFSNETRGTSLATDGAIGTETRRALVAAYMALPGTSLPDGTEVLTHGCGENHNAVPTADGVAEAANRRVEIFFFSGAVTPPPRDRCPGPDGCPEYEQWMKRVSKTVDLDRGVGALDVTVTDQDGKGLEGAAVHLEGPYSEDLETDASGLARFGDLPAGDYTVKALKEGYQEGGVSLSFADGAEVPVTIKLTAAGALAKPSVKSLGVRKAGDEEAQPSITVAPGTEVELVFEVENADKARLCSVDETGMDTELATVDAPQGAAGTYKLTPEKEAKYLVYAVASALPQEQQQSAPSQPVTVQLTGSPFIVQLTAPKRVQSGQPFPLRWTVGGRTSKIALSPGEGLPAGFDAGNLPAQGGVAARIELAPGAAAREVSWTLTAKPELSGQKAAAATVKVQVVPPPAPAKVPPRIVRFGVDPSLVLAGEKAQLAWEVSGDAKLIELGLDDDLIPPGFDPKHVASSGALALTPGLRSDTSEREQRDLQLFVTPAEGDEDQVEFAQLGVARPSEAPGAAVALKGEWDLPDKAQPHGTWAMIDFKFTPFIGFKCKVVLAEGHTKAEVELTLLGKRELKESISSEVHIDDDSFWAGFKLEKVKRAGNAKVDFKKQSAEISCSFEMTFKAIEINQLAALVAAGVPAKVKVTPKLSLDFAVIGVKFKDGKVELDKPGTITTKGTLEVPFGRLPKEKLGLPFETCDFVGYGGLKLKAAPDWLKIAAEVLGFDGMIFLGLTVVALGTWCGIVLMMKALGNLTDALALKQQYDAYMADLLPEIEKGLEDTTFEDLQQSPAVPDDTGPKERGLRLGQVYRGELLQSFRRNDARGYVQILEKQLAAEEPGKREEIISREVRGLFRNQLDQSLPVAVAEAKGFARRFVRDQFYLAFCSRVNRHILADDAKARDVAFRSLYMDGRVATNFDYDFPDIPDAIFELAMGDLWEGQIGLRPTLEANWTDAGYDTFPPDAAARARKRSKRIAGAGQVVDITTGEAADDLSQAQSQQSLGHLLSQRGVTIRKTWPSTLDMMKELGAGTPFANPSAWGRAFLHLPQVENGFDCATANTDSLQPVLAKLFSCDQGVQWAMLDVSKPAWVELRRAQE